MKSFKPDNVRQNHFSLNEGIVGGERCVFLEEELADGLRPEFKEAMDSYEAFYDEYCAFMKKYMENPSDLNLLMEYANMIQKNSEIRDCGRYLIGVFRNIQKNTEKCGSLML